MDNITGHRLGTGHTVLFLPTYNKFFLSMSSNRVFVNLDYDRDNLNNIQSGSLEPSESGASNEYIGNQQRADAAYAAELEQQIARATVCSFITF